MQVYLIKWSGLFIAKNYIIIGSRKIGHLSNFFKSTFIYYREFHFLIVKVVLKLDSLVSGLLDL
jgi:hypothetical protein